MNIFPLKILICLSVGLSKYLSPIYMTKMLTYCTARTKKYSTRSVFYELKFNSMDLLHFFINRSLMTTAAWHYLLVWKATGRLNVLLTCMALWKLHVSSIWFLPTEPWTNLTLPDRCSKGKHNLTRLVNCVCVCVCVLQKGTVKKSEVTLYLSIEFCCPDIALPALYVSDVSATIQWNRQI